MEQQLTKNQILSQLARSPHGKLSEYTPMVRKAAEHEPEFLAHLIAWDAKKGQIRDAKVALPVASLSLTETVKRGGEMIQVPRMHPEFVENSLAHIAKLGPRELVRAYRYAKEIRLPGSMTKLDRLIEQYLREREENPRTWDRIAVQHRATLKDLYALARVKPSDHAKSILFDRIYPANSVFWTIKLLASMAPAAAAGAIISERIPFLIAMGALGEKAKNEDLVMALIQQMTPTELVTNTKMLEKVGIKTNPALRGAYATALEKTATSTKNILKTTRAAEAVTDEVLKEKLRGVQEKQIAAHKGIEGNWLVLGDKSGSMSACIEVARHVSATLAKFVKGDVHLIFFNTEPQYFAATGKSYDELVKDTRHVQAAGGTSIGCGVRYAIARKLDLDGIVVVTDAAENTPPMFVDQYKELCQIQGKDIPVYMYLLGSSMFSYQDQDLRASMKRAGLDMEEFDLTGRTIDYYSIPNLVNSMSASRYSVVDEVMETPLLTLADVFKKTDATELVPA
jgi:hypothetical protein